MSPERRPLILEMSLSQKLPCLVPGVAVQAHFEDDLWQQVVKCTEHRNTHLGPGAALLDRCGEVVDDVEIVFLGGGVQRDHYDRRREAGECRVDLRLLPLERGDLPGERGHGRFAVEHRLGEPRELASDIAKPPLQLWPDGGRAGRKPLALVVIDLEEVLDRARIDKVAAPGLRQGLLIVTGAAVARSCG
jgi:hypothetical protein